MQKELPQFRYILKDPAKYRLQIIYTRIDRDSKNHPKLHTYYYRNLPQEFFSPASTVKLPLALLTIEQLNEIGITGVTKESKFTVDSSFSCQVSYRKDHFTFDSVPRLSSTVSEALVVSDNEAYNRLYDFLGQEKINRRMEELGFYGSRILQRFATCNPEENRYSPSFNFFDTRGNLIHSLTQRYNTTVYSNPIPNMQVGKGYVDEHNRLVKRPMDFSTKNYLPLYQIDEILKRVIFPELFAEDKRFRVGKEIDFIRRLLATRPAETGVAAFSIKKDYWETYTNYLFYGSEEDASIPANIRVFNIVGMSFGFLTDCSYYVDFQTKTEFFLTATIYVNSDGILNDGKYEYKTIGLPFLKALGEAVLNHELHRSVKYRPELSQLKNLFR